MKRKHVDEDGQRKNKLVNSTKRKEKTSLDGQTENNSNTMKKNNLYFCFRFYYCFFYHHYCYCCCCYLFYCILMFYCKCIFICLSCLLILYCFPLFCYICVQFFVVPLNIYMIYLASCVIKKKKKCSSSRPATKRPSITCKDSSRAPPSSGKPTNYAPRGSRHC